jgi:hypothetical protein
LLGKDWLLAAILAPGRRHDAPHLAAGLQRSDLIAGLVKELERLDPIVVRVSQRRSHADEQRNGGEQHEREALGTKGSALDGGRFSVCEHGHWMALDWDE